MNFFDELEVVFSNNDIIKFKNKYYVGKIMICIFKYMFKRMLVFIFFRYYFIVIQKDFRRVYFLLKIFYFYFIFFMDLQEYFILLCNQFFFLIYIV